MTSFHSMWKPMTSEVNFGRSFQKVPPRKLGLVFVEDSGTQNKTTKKATKQ